MIGPKALAYLALSTFFALGLHPVGGRWIQEHYETRKGQETYSYYGPLNRTCFNMGYHNEHHDFAGVPWNNLPKLKKLAPDYYDSLAVLSIVDRGAAEVHLRSLDDRPTAGWCGQGRDRADAPTASPNVLAAAARPRSVRMAKRAARSPSGLGRRRRLRGR